jgi:hypothetical protein
MDELLVEIDNSADVEEPVTIIRRHRPDELPAIGGRELTSGVVGDLVGDRFAEFR